MNQLELFYKRIYKHLFTVSGTLPYYQFRNEYKHRISEQTMVRFFTSINTFITINFTSNNVYSKCTVSEIGISVTRIDFGGDGIRNKEVAKFELCEGIDPGQVANDCRDFLTYFFRNSNYTKFL